MNKLVKQINSDSIIVEFLQVMNGILKLSDRELEVLSFLIDFDMKFVPRPEVNKNVVNTENRKIITEKLGISKDNLSRYIKALKEKGILKNGPAEDGVYVNKALIPEIIGDRLQLTIVLKVNKDDTKKD